MRRLRDIVYINSDFAANTITYYGIEFKEFASAIPTPLKNILVLVHDYWGGMGEQRSSLLSISEKNIKDFIEEDVFSFGDFCWVDYKDKEGLDALEPREIADLLYLGHLKKPVDSPFFAKIANRYAYCAHDDGWFCRLFCREMQDFASVIEYVAREALLKGRKKVVHPMGEELKSKLLEMTQDGLLLDFEAVDSYKGSVWIPIYQIGKFENMDVMYNELRSHIGQAKCRGELIYRKKEWKLDIWEDH